MAPEVYVQPWANAWLSTPTFEKTRTDYYVCIVSSQYTINHRTNIEKQFLSTFLSKTNCLSDLLPASLPGSMKSRQITSQRV